jgi:hypothetical protein
MITDEDTLEKCEGHERSPVQNNPKSNVMVRYEWTYVWIANEVAMMSMDTNAD